MIEITRVGHVIDLKPSYNVILSEAKNLGSLLSRYPTEIDPRCFASLNMTASLARGFRLFDKSEVKAKPKQNEMDD
jgi:hypothetical protein